MASYEREQDQAEDEGHERHKARVQMKTSLSSGPSTDRGHNGREKATLGEPLFAQQIAAMQTMTSRMYGMTNKLRAAADLISGERPPDKGSDQVSPNPITVEQAWQMLCQQLDSLDNQINRFYL